MVHEIAVRRLQLAGWVQEPHPLVLAADVALLHVRHRCCCALLQVVEEQEKAIPTGHHYAAPEVRELSMHA